MGEDVYVGGSHADWETAVLEGPPGRLASEPSRGSFQWRGKKWDKEVRAGIASIFCKRPDSKHFMLRALVFS